ncbi:hypothetical protein [Actinomadura rugatobispora]|uniref:Uncharacterized protein n=1 Tax=Actinomadura rugatobispora TaxID=1994 RepID=A0ABW0ZX39_9ACTN|nr:hypothetical protein GCM10010200_006810 [Actinomadura rugatobispora]
MTAASGRGLHLNAFIQGVGHHEAAWRHPETDPARLTDVRSGADRARARCCGPWHGSIRT